MAAHSLPRSLFQRAVNLLLTSAPWKRVPAKSLCRPPDSVHQDSDACGHNTRACLRRRQGPSFQRTVAAVRQPEEAAAKIPRNMAARIVLNSILSLSTRALQETRAMLAKAACCAPPVP